MPNIANGKVTWCVRRTLLLVNSDNDSVGASFKHRPTAPGETPVATITSISMDELTQELAALEARSLRRRLQVVDEVLPGGKVRVAGQVRLNLSSNDYLGLSLDPRIIAAAQAAAAQWGAGAGASRLVVGHLALHEAVEARLADFKGTEAAVIFPTGYMANVGTISALMGPGDVIFSDRLNHASIYDGIKLSGAALQRFPHRDLNRLEQLLREAGAARRRLIVTDSVFSVDGDLAPLADLVALKARYGAWLMVDEAHATGVLGAKGGGLAEALGLTREVDIHLGTFSKALGSQGGFVAGDRRLVDYLHNRARSFIYSTALAPPVLGAIDQALQIVVQEPERRLFLQAGIREFSPGACSRRAWISWGAKPRLSRCWWEKTTAPWSLPPVSWTRGSWRWPCARPRCRRAGPGCGFPCPRPMPKMTCPGPGRSSWPRPGPWVWGHDHPGLFPRLGRLRPGLGTAGGGLRRPDDGLDAHGPGLGGGLVF